MANFITRLFQGTPPAAPPAEDDERVRALYQQIAINDPYRLFGKTPQKRYNPSALVTVKGLEVFDSIRRDEQARAALEFKKSAILSTGWEVVSPEGEAEDWEVTEFVKQVLTHLDGTLDQTLHHVLSALDYGFSASEKIFTDQDVRHQGQIVLKELRTKKPHGFSFEQDDYGNLSNLLQLQMQGDVRLPVYKFVIYSYGAEFSNYYGVSDLDAAYRAWWSKDNTYKWLVMLLERLGIPPIFALYNSSKYQGGILDRLKDVLANLQAATYGVIPRTGKDDLEFWAPELAQQAVTVFKPALDRFDADIAKAILMPSLIGYTPDAAAGSFARANTHFDSFILVVSRTRNDVAANVVNAQIVKPLVDLNFAGVTNYPQFRWLPFDDGVKETLYTTWNALVTGGVVTRQPQDEQHIRKVFKFPDIKKEANGNDERAISGAAKLGSDDGTGTAGAGTKAPGGGDPTGKAAANAGGDGGQNGADGNGGSADPGQAERKEAALNGAQITAALDVLVKIRSGEILQHAAIELLVAVGIARDRAEAMVNEAVAAPAIIKPELPAPFGAGKSGGAETDEDDDEKKLKKNAGNGSVFVFASRQPNEFERAVDFAQVERDMDGVEKRATDDLSDAFVSVKSWLVGWLKKQGTPKDIDLRELANFRLRGFGDVQSRIKELLRDAYGTGAKTMVKELRVAKRKEFAEPMYVPTEALKYLDMKTLMIGQSLREKVTNDAKLIIMNSIKVGDTTGEIVAKLDAYFAQYIGDDRTLQDGEDISPAKLETIVRTTTTEAYNNGRLIMMRDPALEGLIQYVEYSGVIDSRTTEVCQYLDGKIMRVDQPELDRLTPPNHYNCRSLLVPIPLSVKVDKAQIIKPSQIGRALELANKSFI